MKALLALVCLVTPLAWGAEDRAATLNVPAAVVCGRGMTPKDAILELNHKLSDEKGVEVSSSGIKLMVRGPFTVSAPVLEGFSQFEPNPVFPVRASDELSAPAYASACVTVASLSGPQVQPAPAGPYR